MWGLLRIILLVGNALIFAWLAYLFATNIGLPKDPQSWFGLGVLICSALNVLYLLLANRTPNWRIFRLISLWFDAKESELRQRADRSRQDK